MFFKGLFVAFSFLRSPLSALRSLVFIALTLTLPLSYAQAQNSVQLKAYYPEPIAAYSSIQLAPYCYDDQEINCLNIGDTCKVGEIFLLKDPGDNSKDIYVCYDDGAKDPDQGTWGLMKQVWTQDNSIENHQDIFLSDLDNADAINVGIGTQSPEFKLTLDNDGGILALDDFNDPDLLALPPSAEGEGIRFFWYPLKSAIRAGATSTLSTISAHPDDYDSTGQQWNDTNIGANSTAFGLNNQSSGNTAMVLGGENNAANTTHATIAGGYGNAVGFDFAAIAGGENNINTSKRGDFAFIGGGSGNSIENDFDVIIGGMNNRTVNTNNEKLCSSVIGGGFDNVIADSDGTSIIGGRSHEIAGESDVAVITGGQENQISDCFACFVGGGNQNIIFSSQLASIAGGQQNAVGNNDSWTFVVSILGGSDNAIDNGAVISIIGGQDNRIASAEGESILDAISGGRNNTIESTVVSPACQFFGCSFSGSECCTENGANFIGGGSNNTITGDIVGNAIMGGTTNLSQDNQFSLMSGYHNQTLSSANTVVSGVSNKTNLSASSWVGGRNMNTENSNGLFVWGHHTHTDFSPSLINKNNAVILFPPDDDPGTAPDTYPGKVGIQTLSPQYELDVAGNTHATGSLFLTGLPTTPSATKSLYINTTTGEFLKTNDLAEAFETDHSVSPGDLLVMTINNENLEKSSLPYDQRVIGIVSSSPAVILKGTQTIMAPISSQEPTKKPPIALKGRVPVKVTLENGPIEPGDALTSSSVPGHAMKSTDIEKSWGATIGKALEGFAGGPNGEREGTILVFVTLY